VIGKICLKLPAVALAAAVGLSTFRLLDPSTPESAEQSENVYENKGSPYC
jgi:hypothetical protein